jgi:hypothetical protein
VDEPGVHGVVAPALMIAAKAIAGGCLVVAFSMLSNRLKPKMLAGLFSGAPSVALTSLGLTAFAMGSGKASVAATSMIAGAAGMVVFCAVAMAMEQKVGAITSSALAWMSWAFAAGAVFWFFLR